MEIYDLNKLYKKQRELTDKQSADMDNVAQFANDKAPHIFHELTEAVRDYYAPKFRELAIRIDMAENYNDKASKAA